jgi:hypothetical protein
MKTKLLLCLAAFTLVASNALFAADEEEKLDSVELGAVIAMCEEQYTPEIYPDDEERNRLIEQCISDNTPQPAG